MKARAVARALIRGGGVYSYIRVMPDGSLLKSVVFKLISKEISRAEHEYMNIHPPPPPPINALATVLVKGSAAYNIRQMPPMVFPKHLSTTNLPIRIIVPDILTWGNKRDIKLIQQPCLHP